MRDFIHVMPVALEQAQYERIDTVLRENGWTVYPNSRGVAERELSRVNPLYKDIQISFSFVYDAQYNFGWVSLYYFKHCLNVPDISNQYRYLPHLHINIEYEDILNNVKKADLVQWE